MFRTLSWLAKFFFSAPATAPSLSVDYPFITTFQDLVHALHASPHPQASQSHLVASTPELSFSLIDERATGDKNYFFEVWISTSNDALNLCSRAQAPPSTSTYITGDTDFDAAFVVGEEATISDLCALLTPTLRSTLIALGKSADVNFARGNLTVSLAISPNDLRADLLLDLIQRTTAAAKLLKPLKPPSNLTDALISLLATDTAAILLQRDALRALALRTQDRPLDIVSACEVILRAPTSLPALRLWAAITIGPEAYPVLKDLISTLPTPLVEQSLDLILADASSPQLCAFLQEILPTLPGPINTKALGYLISHTSPLELCEYLKTCLTTLPDPIHTTAFHFLMRNAPQLLDLLKLLLANLPQSTQRIALDHLITHTPLTELPDLVQSTLSPFMFDPSAPLLASTLRYLQRFPDPAHIPLLSKHAASYDLNTFALLLRAISAHHASPEDLETIYLQHFIAATELNRKHVIAPLLIQYGTQSSVAAIQKILLSDPPPFDPNHALNIKVITDIQLRLQQDFPHTAGDLALIPTAESGTLAFSDSPPQQNLPAKK